MHWPRARNGKTCFDQSFKHGLPASRCNCSINRIHGFVGFGLFKRVVDYERNTIYLNTTHILKRLEKAILEKLSGCFLITAKSVRFGDELLGFGHEYRTKNRWVNRMNCTSQPDVEEVRQVRVTHIVIVRRIGTNCG